MKIERGFDLIETTDADVVFGTWASVQSEIVVRQPAARRLSGTAFNAVIRLLALSTLSDTRRGLKRSAVASSEIVARVRDRSIHAD